MALALTISGWILILAALRDILHELFHPEDSGSISRGVMHVVWRLTRRVARMHRSAICHAGPLMLVAVATTWGVMLVTGFALIYLPRLPGSFTLASGLRPGAGDGFLTAVYVSAAGLSTLGASDVTPATPLLRLVVTMESLVGIAMITAWITWVLSIYPVLAERKALAHKIALHRRAGDHVDAIVRDRPREAVTETLRSLSRQTLRVSSQLTQARITYYFENDEPERTLGKQLPWLLALAREAERNGGVPGVRHLGTVLRRAIEELLRYLGDQYLDLRDASPEDTLRALAQDHLLDAPSAAGEPSA